MSNPLDNDLDQLYAESAAWQVNTGTTTIHAKRLPGRWRRIKWWAAAVWLIFFLGPYVPWDGRQAVLFDIPNRQYHLFAVTVLPQDFWMLSLLLLFFAVLLAVTTVIAGRVYCGFFCFQTVWTDVFTWLEEWLEGPPQQRRQPRPLTKQRLQRLAIKHGLWLLIGLLTGLSFVAWFYGAIPLWRDFFVGAANGVVYTFVALFTAGTYLLAGWLREQVCFWLCPYARIQGVMLDRTTIVPAYDLSRGEPRGRLKKDAAANSQGDCIDCNLCVAVCPTGIDIRKGQQEGCITCALCLDACDQVMDKIDRPRGLIRYASLDELEGQPTRSLLTRPRVWLYGAILLLSLSGILYGLSTINTVELHVLHEQSPLFVELSDGSIQNRYTLKIFNKTHQAATLSVTATSAVPLTLHGVESELTLGAGEITPVVAYIKIAPQWLDHQPLTLNFALTGRLADGTLVNANRDHVFYHFPANYPLEITQSD